MRDEELRRDKSLANLYQSATDGYAVGDLIKSQRTNDISGIKVKKYDQVYFELTRVDLNTTEDCDTIEFNPTFTVDTTADMHLHLLPICLINFRSAALW